jgi:hypothetical protein
MIPPVVFQVCMFLLLILFSIGVPSYWFRRKRFPIAQRLPRIVTCEMILVTCDGLLELIAASYPQSLTFAECKTFLLSTSVIYYLSITLIAWRLTWVFVKNFSTQSLIESNGALETKENNSASCCKRLHKRALEFILKHFTVKQFVAIVLTPAAICAIADIAILSKDKTGPLSVFADECYFNLMFQTNVFKSIISVILLSLVAFAFSVIWSLKDGLSLGTEIRALFLPTVILGIFNFATATRSSWGKFLFQEAIHHFALGYVIASLVLIIQAYFPLYLSLRQQSTEKKYRETFRASKTGKLLEGVELNCATPSHKNENDSILQMQKVISDPEGRMLFLRFLEKEFSVENLLFYEACLQFESNLSSRDSALTLKAKTEAQVIFDTYISAGSASSVNISASNRRKLTKILGKQRKKTALAQVQNSLKRSKILHMSTQGPFFEFPDENVPIEVDTFAEAKNEIIQLMVRDSFFRFRMTPAFEQYWEHIQQSPAL